MVKFVNIPEQFLGEDIHYPIENIFGSFTGRLGFGMGGKLCYEDELFYNQIQAIDPEGVPVFFQIVRGHLPLNIYLNPVTGEISSGNEYTTLRHLETPDPNDDEHTLMTDYTWNFVVEASAGLDVSRQGFSITIKHRNKGPVFYGANTVVGLEGNSINAAVLAYDPEHPDYPEANANLHFETTLPPPLANAIVMSNSGVFSGNLPLIDNLKYQNIANVTTNSVMVVTASRALVPGERLITMKNSNIVATMANSSSINFPVSSGDALVYRFSGIFGDDPVTFTANVAGDEPYVFEAPLAFTFNVTVTDAPKEFDPDFPNTPSAPLSNSRTYKIYIDNSNEPPEWVTNSALPGGTEGNAVSFQFEAFDPDGDPLTYTLETGELPNGLTLSSDGLLSGTLGPPHQIEVPVSQQWYTIAPTLTSQPIEDTSHVVFLQDEGFEVFRTNAGESLSISDDIQVEPIVGRTYTLAITVRKIVKETNGIKSYLRPVFDYLTDSGYQPIFGNRSGPGYVTDTHNVGWDYFDTTDWTIGKWYTIYATFVWPNNPVSPRVRGRTRYNRSAIPTTGDPGADFSVASNRKDGPPYSDAVFEFKGQTLVNSEEKFTLKVADPDGLFDLREFTMTVTDINVPPEWQTAASLGDFMSGNAINIPLLATDADDDLVTYSLTNGQLPPGTSLNGGVISGQLPVVNAVTTYTATISANDGVNPPVPRTFTLNVTTIPIDVTPDPVDWTDTYAEGPTDASWIPGVSIGGNTNKQVIKGINTTITLVVTANKPLASGANLAVYKNGAALTDALAQMTQTETSCIFDVQNNDEIVFRYGGYTDDTVVFTVTNQSDNNAVLDTFSGVTNQTNEPGPDPDPDPPAQNQPPIWDTPSGSIGTFGAGSAVNIQLVGHDPENTPITYALVAGTLPNGITLSPSGLISGTAPSSSVPSATPTGLTPATQPSDNLVFDPTLANAYGGNNRWQDIAAWQTEGGPYMFVTKNGANENINLGTQVAVSDKFAVYSNSNYTYQYTALSYNIQSGTFGVDIAWYDINNNLIGYSAAIQDGNVGNPNTTPGTQVVRSKTVTSPPNAAWGRCRVYTYNLVWKGGAGGFACVVQRLMVSNTGSIQTWNTNATDGAPYRDPIYTYGSVNNEVTTNFTVEISDGELKTTREFSMKVT